MTNSIKQSYQVAIVGAGPCGIATANLLGGYGISTLVVDRADDILPIPRAVAMCEEGSRVLAAAGILDQVEQQLKPANRVAFQDKDQQQVFFAETSEPVHGYKILRTFHQPSLERAMRDQLDRFEHVELHTGTALESFEDGADGVQLKLVSNGQPVTTSCRYLLACDGASSEIRKSLGIGFKGKSYPQDWLIVDCVDNPFQGAGVAFSINPERPAVTIQGPGNRRRWEFLIKDDDDPEYLMSEQGITEILQPWCTPEELKIERTAIYTFHARVADRFQHNNVFLLGDAAHITPPFAGQGMMAGLRDAYNISWKLAWVLKGQLPHESLQSYETERIPQCRQVVGFAKFMGAIILPQNKVKARLRDGFFKVLRLLGLHSDDQGLPLNKVANHINGGYFRNIARQMLLKTGMELPQHYLSVPGGEQKLADSLMGDRFYLLGWNNDPAGRLSKSTLQRWHSLEGQSVDLNSATAQPPFSDADQHYRELFKNGDVVLVIRPDKMIVVRCKPSELEAKLNDYLDDLGAKSFLPA